MYKLEDLKSFTKQHREVIEKIKSVRSCSSIECMKCPFHTSNSMSNSSCSDYTNAIGHLQNVGFDELEEEEMINFLSTFENLDIEDKTIIKVEIEIDSALIRDEIGKKLIKPLPFDYPSQNLLTIEERMELIAKAVNKKYGTKLDQAVEADEKILLDIFVKMCNVSKCIFSEDGKSIYLFVKGDNIYFF